MSALVTCPRCGNDRHFKVELSFTYDSPLFSIDELKDNWVGRLVHAICEECHLYMHKNADDQWSWSPQAMMPKRMENVTKEDLAVLQKLSLAQLDILTKALKEG